MLPIPTIRANETIAIKTIPARTFQMTMCPPADITSAMIPIYFIIHACLLHTMLASPPLEYNLKTHTCNQPPAIHAQSDWNGRTGRLKRHSEKG